MMRLAFAILALAALSGCGNLPWPDAGPAVPRLSNPPPASAARAAPPKTVTVAGSDTLFSLSRRYGVSPRDIIEANNLQPPYRLSVGQRLVLPAPRTHVVQRGDTLIGIARRYGVDSYEMARLNRLLPPYIIRPNQTLVIPGGGDPTPPGGVEVVDRRDVPPASVARGATPAVRVEAVEEVAVRDVAPPKAAPAPSASSEPSPAPAPAAETTRDQAQQVASLPKPPARPRGGSRFIWPIRGGKITSEYGSKGDGLHNDGINIAAPKGTPVVAAAPGVVAYAGNEIRGFGNLLLIRHADGWMTAYAHNDKLLVKRGDSVEQGQPIAHVGATGNVVSPQLHFEIRRGKRAVDPLDQLGSPRTS